MAKPSWLTTTPGSGSGNGNISNTATAHTGRVQRTGTVTVTASGLATPKTYTVNQEPKDEFVSWNDGSEMAVVRTGGTVTVQGRSNSKKLTFSWVGSGSNVSIPTAYTANGASATGGSNIAGDPGATAEYSFSIALSFPANTTVSEVSRTLKVTADGAQVAQIVLRQTAGEPTLSLGATEITIPQAGSPAVSVSVTSNTSWSVS